jgi:hypothetical protein
MVWGWLIDQKRSWVDRALTAEVDCMLVGETT